MDRYLLRTVLSIGLLVVTTWIGIALFAKLHTGTEMVELIVLWGIGAASVVWFAIRNMTLARQARVERESELTRGR